MDVQSIIDQLTAERTRIDEAIRALSGFATTTTTAKGKRGRPKGSTNTAKPAKKKRTMTAEGRARIAAAQKARWAAAKKKTA